jgi:hypothetical protein
MLTMNKSNARAHNGKPLLSQTPIADEGGFHSRGALLPFSLLFLFRVNENREMDFNCEKGFLRCGDISRCREEVGKLFARMSWPGERFLVCFKLFEWMDATVWVLISIVVVRLLLQLEPIEVDASFQV